MLNYEEWQLFENEGYVSKLYLFDLFKIFKMYK